MAGHQVWMVRASRVASGMLGVERGVVEVGQPPPDLGGSCSASSIRSRSLTAQAAPISSVGSAAVEHAAEPSPLLGRQVLGAGEQQPPVHPHRVGDACRGGRAGRG